MPPSRVMLIYTMPPPALAVDGQGRLLAAWTDARHRDADVLFRRSKDGGSSWSAPVRLNDDRVGNGATQYLPRCQWLLRDRCETTCAAAPTFGRRGLPSRPSAAQVVSPRSLTGG